MDCPDIRVSENGTSLVATCLAMVLPMVLQIFPDAKRPKLIVPMPAK